MVPTWIRLTHPRVKRFVQQALDQLDPHIPDRPHAPLHDETMVRQLVGRWAPRIGVEPGRVQLRDMTRKWGSCSSRGNITFNTALYYIPAHLVEYVVVHELVHMLVFDHSPAFWRMLGRFLPDYADREQELNTYRV